VAIFDAIHSSTPVPYVDAVEIVVRDGAAERRFHVSAFDGEQARGAEASS
jgi:hypothetical protein